jgi:hypothetical protein
VCKKFKKVTWEFLTRGSERGPKKKILGENSIPPSQSGASISTSRAETSAPFFRKSALWVLVFSTSKGLHLTELSAQFFSKSFFGPWQRVRGFA